jgi:dTDP-4-amino-4,6-dideoxygalactose transaminase
MPPKYEEILNKDMQSVTVRLKNTDAATAGNYGAFFIASRPYEVMEIRAVWSTASTSGTLQLERLTGTTAEGSGDSVLTSTIDLAGTANTVVKRETTGLQNRKLAPGDRLALVDGGTLTNLVNLVVTVLLKPNKGDYK